tara:strand:+ start:455 stop:898 length:444 start_codon:yes stop_codon:yes gene_type:complete
MVTDKAILVATTLGKIVSTQLIKSGRFGGEGTLPEKYSEFDNVLSDLLNIGVEQSEIDNIKESVKVYAYIDYCGSISRIIQKTLNSEQSKIWHEFWSEYPDQTKLTTKELRAFIEENDLMHDGVEERLAAFENYEKTGSHIDYKMLD